MYEAIVIGQDLSSLTAALTAVRSGLKTVLVVEDSLEAEHREAGYAFSIDPTPLSGFGQGQIISQLLARLNLNQDGLPPVMRLDPALQIILPGHRVDIFQDRERLIAEMIREFPERPDEIRRFYHAVEKAGALLDKWIREDFSDLRQDLRGFLRRAVLLPAVMTGRFSLTLPVNGKGNSFRRVIEAQMGILSHLEINDRLPFSAAYLLSLPARGLFYPCGGRNAWMKWFCKRFIDSGGILQERCSVIRIDTEPEIRVDLEREGGSSTLQGNKLIVSTSWEKLNLLLLSRKPFSRLSRSFKTIRPVAYPFCLHMGVHEGGIPERMAPYVVVVPDETRSIREGNFVFLETSITGDTDRAPQGCRSITAMVSLKDSPLRLDDSELKEHATGIIDSLEGFLPFLRENIDYIHVEKSIALSRQCQERVNQKYRAGKSRILGMNTMLPKTPVRNVFLTGGILMADQGFEGEILSGMKAAFLAESEVHNHG
jgi:phytoene dehydrogenase-like protein